MAIEFDNPLTAGTVLVREAIQSQNYTPGSQGWIIQSDGDAEFNDVVIRGATVLSGTALYYDGTPAFGNLIMSIAASAGTDEFGNEYAAGMTLYNDNGTINMFGTTTTWKETNGDSGIQILVGSGAVLQQFAPAAVTGVTWTNGGVGATLQSRLGTNTPLVFLESPTNSFFPTSTASLVLYGYPETSNGDVTSEAIIDAQRFTVNAPVGWIDGNWSRVSEVWQSPTMGTGWALGPGIPGSYPPLQFRHDVEGNVHVFGTFHTTSTTPSTIIASGLPGVDLSVMGGVGVAGAAPKVLDTSTFLPMYLNETGQLRTSKALAAYSINDTFMFNAVIPLGTLI